MEPAYLFGRYTPKTWKLKVVEIEQSGEVNDSTEQYYQEALHDAAHQSGPEHKDVAEAATYLADLYMFLERYGEAEALYRRALKIYAKALGDESMVYSMALRNLAEALQARGKADEADKMRYQARGIFG